MQMLTRLARRHLAIVLAFVVPVTLASGPSVASAHCSKATERLISAVRAQNVQAVHRALAAGADPNAIDPFDDCVCLAHAIATNSGQIARLLIRYGAKVNYPHGPGGVSTPPIQTALAYEDESLARLLIERGAKINERDSAGYTPLMMAVWVGDPDIVRMLLTRGADIAARANNGTDAMQISRRHVRALEGHWRRFDHPGQFQPAIIVDRLLASIAQKRTGRGRTFGASTSTHVT